jgi:hypothetical protein
MISLVYELHHIIIIGSLVVDVDHSIVHHIIRTWTYSYYQSLCEDIIHLCHHTRVIRVLLFSRRCLLIAMAYHQCTSLRVTTPIIIQTVMLICHLHHHHSIFTDHQLLSRHYHHYHCWHYLAALSIISVIVAACHICVCVYGFTRVVLCVMVMVIVVLMFVGECVCYTGSRCVIVG